jgi:hypothetical protein
MFMMKMKPEVTQSAPQNPYLLSVDRITRSGGSKGLLSRIGGAVALAGWEDWIGSAKL